MKFSSPNLLILIFALLLGAGAAFWLAKMHPPAEQPAQPAVAVEKPKTAAPEFTFTDIKGREHSLSDYAGKTVILNFWATWCVPCVAEMPKLLELAQRHKDKAVLIAMTGETNMDNIEKFVSRHKVKGGNVVVGHDPDKKITQDTFQTYSLPETIIIGPDGKMVRKFVGAEWNPEEVSGIISTLHQ